MLVFKPLLFSVSLIHLSVGFAAAQSSEVEEDATPGERFYQSSFEPLVRRLRLGSKGHHPHLHHRTPEMLDYDHKKEESENLRIYKRKAVNAHTDNTTRHHFHDVEGHHDYNTTPIKDADEQTEEAEEGDPHHHHSHSHSDGGPGHKHHGSQPKHANSEEHHESHRKHAAYGEHHGGDVGDEASRADERPTDERPTEETGADGMARRDGLYRIVKEYSGSTFFDNFFFFTSRDPSGGMVSYVSKDEARSAGLIGTRNGNAFMKIGQGSNGVQKAVRISTDDTFTTGIIILDAYHMPTGCG